jgi:hypothetical protein
MPRPRPPLLAVLLGILAAAALFGLGRVTAPATGAARARGYHDGAVAGSADGFQAGRAQGLQEGQAIAATAPLPPGPRARAKAAFVAGYRAGANAAFSGYDGGWSLGQPYVVVLTRGANGVTYRIAARAQCPRTSTTTPTSLLACQTGR